MRRTLEWILLLVIAVTVYAVWTGRFARLQAIVTKFGQDVTEAEKSDKLSDEFSGIASKFGSDLVQALTEAQATPTPTVLSQVKSLGILLRHTPTLPQSTPTYSPQTTEVKKNGVTAEETLGIIFSSGSFWVEENDGGSKDFDFTDAKITHDRCVYRIENPSANQDGTHSILIIDFNNVSPFAEISESCVITFHGGNRAFRAINAMNGEYDRYLNNNFIWHCSSSPERAERALKFFFDNFCEGNGKPF